MVGIISELRAALRGLNKSILEHRAAESPNKGILHRFVLNQLYIVPNDLKALSGLVARASSDIEINFFKSLLDGDFSAYHHLVQLSDELNTKLDLARISPRAVTYTHFLAWLALHGTAGDAAVALTVNLPVWGANTDKIGRWAKRRGIKNTGFFELFRGPYEELERQGESIARGYLDWERYRFVSRAIQRYELDFWDSLA